MVIVCFPLTLNMAHADLKRVWLSIKSKQKTCPEFNQLHESLQQPQSKRAARSISVCVQLRTKLLKHRTRCVVHARIQRTNPTTRLSTHRSPKVLKKDQMPVRLTGLSCTRWLIERYVSTLEIRERSTISSWKESNEDISVSSAQARHKRCRISTPTQRWKLLSPSWSKKKKIVRAPLYPLRYKITLAYISQCFDRVNNTDVGIYSPCSTGQTASM